MKFSIKGTLLMMPLLALAAPASAQIIRPAGLADSELPGSAIIFPKFINKARITVDGISNVSRTEIEIGAVCPPGVTPTTTICQEHQPVKVRFHWVCPGSEGVFSNICSEEDFDVVLSVNGKLAFAADGIPINANSPTVPAAPCPLGYLIGWVENIADQPIKFDGLVGNAVIRGSNTTAISAYSALTIQANEGNNLNDVLTAGAFNAQLLGNVPGTYKTYTAWQTGDVRYDLNPGQTPPTGSPAVLSQTFLTFLTLDVLSNLPNNPTFVPLSFYNESLGGAGETIGSTNVNFERVVSTDAEFICWVQLGLTAPSMVTVGNGVTVTLPGINTNLNQTATGMATRKGVVIAGPAAKVAEVPNDLPGIVTLLALVETEEGPTLSERKYNYSMDHYNTPGNIIPITTQFVPTP